jgi:hypothetical protein
VNDGGKFGPIETLTMLYAELVGFGGGTCGVVHVPATALEAWRKVVRGVCEALEGDARLGKARKLTWGGSLDGDGNMIWVAASETRKPRCYVVSQAIRGGEARWVRSFSGVESTTTHDSPEEAKSACEEYDMSPASEESDLGLRWEEGRDEHGNPIWEAGSIAVPGSSYRVVQGLREGCERRLAFLDGREITGGECMFLEDAKSTCETYDLGLGDPRRLAEAPRETIRWRDVSIPGFSKTWEGESICGPDEESKKYYIREIGVGDALCYAVGHGDLDAAKRACERFESGRRGGRSHGHGELGG